MKSLIRNAQVTLIGLSFLVLPTVTMILAGVR